MDPASSRVDVRVDPTKAQFEQSMRDLRDADWSDFGSSVVCVMAHGSMRSGVQKVTASDDQQVDLQELYGLLAATSCPGLRGKPKIWIVQACRVGGAALVADDIAEIDAGPILTRNHDFLLTYATMPGNVARRGGECLTSVASLGGSVTDRGALLRSILEQAARACGGERRRQGSRHALAAAFCLG